MTPVEQLEVARALLAPPGAWCQNALGRCPLGRPVAPLSREAVSRCGIGALRAADRGNLPFMVVDLLAEATGETFAVWQDRPGRSQAEVLAVFDRAIARGRAAEGEPA